LPILTTVALIMLVSSTVEVRPAWSGGLGKVTGHLGFGYAKLFIPDAPGGSLSTAVGFHYPLDERWGVGLGLGYHLLGSSTVERGSFVASLDYSVFDISFMAEYNPTRLGPLARVAFGPGIFNAHAELSSSGGGLSFMDLPVEETALGVGLDLTFMSKKPAKVRAGLELSGRLGFLEEENWPMGAVRLVVHY
jgi:hypothetical protein